MIVYCEAKRYLDFSAPLAILITFRFITVHILKHKQNTISKAHICLCFQHRCSMKDKECLPNFFSLASVWLYVPAPSGHAVIPPQRESDLICLCCVFLMEHVNIIVSLPLCCYGRILNTTLFESWEIVGPYPSWWVFNLLLILLQLLHSFWSYLIVKTACRAISKGKVSHSSQLHFQVFMCNPSIHTCYCIW